MSLAIPRADCSNTVATAIFTMMHRMPGNRRGFVLLEASGRPTYPDAKMLLIAADCAGRLRKIELQKIAATGVEVHMSDLPPGTGKWNKIE